MKKFLFLDSFLLLNNFSLFRIELFSRKRVLNPEINTEERGVTENTELFKEENLLEYAKMLDSSDHEVVLQGLKALRVLSTGPDEKNLGRKAFRIEF